MGNWRERRGGIALACAVIVHALATAALRLVSPHVAAPHVAVEPPATTTFAIETIDETAARDESRETHEAPHAAAAARETHSVARIEGTRAREATVDAPPTAIIDTPSEASANDHANGDAWSLRVTRVDIGIDGRGTQTPAGRNGTATSTAIAPDAAPRDTSTTGGLAEALDEHDVAMGLGRGGPIRSAIEDAVQASNVMGTAAFEVRVETSGVVSVGLRDASADAASWARLVDTIRASVLAKRASLRLPPGARGLSVVVEASAKDLLPDGRSPSRLGTRAEGTLGSITESKERIDIKLPSVTVAHEGKVCAAGVHVGLDGIGILGGCSPENAGQTPVRMVAARIVREARL